MRCLAGPIGLLKHRTPVPMPTLAKAAHVPIPGAERLADLYGIEFDLKGARKLCFAAQEYGSERRDPYVLEAMIVAAVIKYFRCFGRGMRANLKPSDVAVLGHEKRSAHDYFKNLRDKFIAHPVNHFEDSFVTATVRKRDGVMLPITSVHPGQHRLVLSMSEASTLIDLIASVEDLIRQRIRDEEAALLEILRAIPLEVVHSWDLHASGPMNVTDAGKPRSRTSRRSGPRSNN